MTITEDGAHLGLIGWRRLIVTIAVFLGTYSYLYVAAAIPIISPGMIGELGGMEYFALVATIYLLFAAIGKPFGGKLSDIVGTKKVFVWSIILFGISSFMCGTAASISQLMIYRAIQGLFGGVSMTTAYILVGDLYPRDQAPKWVGFLASLTHIAYTTAPLISGLFMDYGSWRYTFYFLVPFTVVSAVFIAVFTPNKPHTSEKRFDFLGALFMTVFAFPLLMTLSWGGSKYPWSSGTIIGLIALTALGLVAFLFQEKRMGNAAIVPFSLFSGVGGRNFIVVFIGIAMYSWTMAYSNYWPLLAQAVMGKSATASAIPISILRAISIVSSLFIGQYLTKTGKYRIPMIAATFFTGLGCLMLSFFTASTNWAFVGFTMYGILATGGGLSAVVYVAYAQARISKEVVGSAVGALQFVQGIGVVFATSIAGAIINSTYKVSEMVPKELTSVMTPAKLKALSTPSVLIKAEAMEKIKASFPPELQGYFTTMVETMRSHLNVTMRYIFLLLAFGSLVGLITVFFLKDRAKEELADSKANVRVNPSA